jgi:hypothetical protein
MVTVVSVATGCVLPDHDEVQLELRDGESLAVDWHFEVFETLLDTQALCAVNRHRTATESAVSAHSVRTELPISLTPISDT